MYYFLIILCFYCCTLSLFQYSCRKQPKFRRDLILIVTLNTLFCFLYIFDCWYLTNFSTHFCDRLQLWKKLRQLKLNTLNFKVTYLSPICQHCLLLMNMQAGWNWNQSGIWYSYPLLLSGICILSSELFITPKYQYQVSSFFVWTMYQVFLYEQCKIKDHWTAWHILWEKAVRKMTYFW